MVPQTPKPVMKPVPIDSAILLAVLLRDSAYRGAAGEGAAAGARGAAGAGVGAATRPLKLVVLEFRGAGVEGPCR